MRITGRTRLAGIMGWPVTHSRSPALHNFWLEQNGIDGAYVPLLPAGLRSEQLLQALRAGYGRAKAEQLAEVAGRRFQASVHRTVGTDGSLTVRVRF